VSDADPKPKPDQQLAVRSSDMMSWIEPRVDPTEGSPKELLHQDENSWPLMNPICLAAKKHELLQLAKQFVQFKKRRPMRSTIMGFLKKEFFVDADWLHKFEAYIAYDFACSPNFNENGFYSKIEDGHFETKHPGEISNSKYIAKPETYRWLGSGPSPSIYDKEVLKQPVVDEEVWKLLHTHFGGQAIPKNAAQKPNLIKLRILPTSLEDGVIWSKT
jgi:hypothetical protein